MLSKYIQLENLGDELYSLKNNVRGGIPSAAFGVQFSHKCHIAASLGLPVLYIARDGVTARAAAAEMRVISGERAVYLPAKEDVLLYNKSFSKDLTYGRIAALYELSRGVKFAACTFESLFQLMPRKIDALLLNVGAEYDFSELLKRLVSIGYKRVEEVEKKGEFCLRGDILQIFAINAESPVRADFFGDELENIRVYESVGGELGESLKTLTVLPAVDFYIDPAERGLLKEKLRAEKSRLPQTLYSEKSREIISDLIERLDNGDTSQALSFLSPLLDRMRGSIADYISRDAVIIFDEPKLLRDEINGIVKEHYERCLSLKRSGEALSFTSEQYKKEEDVLREIDFPRKLALSSLTARVEFFNPLFTLSVNCGTVPRYFLKPAELFTDIRNWRACGYRVLVCCGTAERAERLSLELDKRGVFNDKINEFDEDFSGVKITEFYLTSGFVYHESKTVIVGTGDVYARAPAKKLKRKRGDFYTAPKEGDYCVHEVHGVGVVRGTKRITTSDSTKDYVAIEYRGGDMLYVCVDRMDCLTKYLGAEEHPQLSKIGGQEFERIKERVKASIKALSINLKRLYRERSAKKGYAYPPDDALMEEFENAFEHEPTEDQLQSIAEIKRDMESDKVMDRLLCGDVGYGKTEVAMRAAFKAIENGKQVAFVAPTTVLTEQHYMNCIKRYADFGVRIGVLNRFRSSSEQEKTLYELSEGKIDLLIGTHRAFSKDVKFKDLGLLILDEEQRFGVEHKEKLKLLKENVDALSMSATPIPRTLHMSLSGIRDISTINTPPTNRIPVQTFVTELSDSLIKDAIIKELSREGQTFVLFNRVESIEGFAAHIKELVPEARVTFAHGQMPEKTLEQRVLAFYKKEYDVLVSTTIIENGVDIPDANTIIVTNADRLGLSTLYQLKGRVGRSDKMARAYFTYESQKVLTDAAFKRLSALTEYTDLGSGFKIAMRDLEIRGAGNVLGREQHGHMDKIGYELYSKLLKQELGEVPAAVETETDICVSAYIPDEYLEAGERRMECYKQIAEINSDDDENRVRALMVENYGRLPEAVENLFLIARLRRLCSRFGIKKAEIGKNGSRLVLTDMQALKRAEGLAEAVMKSDGAFKFDFSSEVAIAAGENLASDKTALLAMLKLLSDATD